MGKDRAAAGELYELRKVALEAERLGLQAQLRQVEARLLLLEMEREYGLLTGEGKLDINTGKITRGGDEEAKEG